MPALEEGYRAALIWDVGDTFALPSRSEQPEVAPERERI